MKFLQSTATNLKAGFGRLQKNPQLLYTIGVAVIICVAFLFVADRFVRIAQDAQERLINVRVGSIQDVFVEFAADLVDEPEVLQERITSIAAQNETIQSFQVVRFGQEDRIVVASLAQEHVGMPEEETPDFLYSLAAADPANSFTFEERGTDERFFRTIRSVVDGEGSVVGAVITRQTLSEADRQIGESIRNSMVVLFAILILILLLFLRHSKIIDYAALYKRLQEVDQMKDDFISMASHELRTPLTVIRGYADVLSDSVGKGNKEAQEYVGRIDLSAKQLDGLVNDILEVSRIEQNRITLKVKELNPSDIVKEVAESFEYQAKQKGLSLMCEAEARSKIAVDADRFRQILINIVGNAVKYTKKGEVKITLSQQEKNVVVRVSDTGIGLSAEEQKKIFQKFYRVQSKQTADIPGTGLGLWITGELVKAMAGTISLESIKGVGTHVIISFPALSTPQSKRV